jgi:hypothetical protein
LVLLFLLLEQGSQEGLILRGHGARASRAFLGGEVARVLELALETVDTGLGDGEAGGDVSALVTGLQGSKDALSQIERESVHKGRIPQLSILSVKTITRSCARSMT